MKLAKAVMNRAGMVLLGEGTMLTDVWIKRIRDMEIQTIQIDGTEHPNVSKEELLTQLDRRFRIVEDKPYMAFLKNVIKEHIEESYG